MFTQIITRQRETHTERLNALCGQNADISFGTAGGALSSHRVLEI
jgi:hypothetical protein